MKKVKILFRMVELVKPLAHIMLVAILFGVLGFLCADLLSVIAVYGLLEVLNYQNITHILLLLVALGILRGFLRYIEQTSNHYIAFKLLAHIRDKVFSAMRKLAPARIEGKDKGNLISIITSDIELLEVFYAHTISPVLIALIMSLLMIIFFTSYSWILGIYALISYLTIGILIPMYIHHKSKGLGNKLRKVSGDMSSYVLETLRGQKEIIQYDYFSKRINTMKQKQETLSSYEKTMKEIQGENSALSGFFILAFSLGMILLSNQLIDPQSSLIVSVALLSSFPPVLALANLSSTIQPTLAAFKRVLNLLDETPNLQEVENGEKIISQEIRLENIEFSHDNQKVIHNLSLQTNKEMIGISGKSGCGKSTLLKLLMRFWDIQKGKLTIDGKKIHNIQTSELRNHQSYMTQSTHLFHDSILNNIKIAKLDASLEEVIEASKKASLHDFIQTLPKGYDTPISECGDSLSGGERQRIGLARAFLHDGDFILLDEPTSNLDSLNEKIILNSLKRQSSSKTVFLVSHRLSTLKGCDRILHMKEGYFE